MPIARTFRPSCLIRSTDFINDSVAQVNISAATPGMALERRRLGAFVQDSYQIRPNLISITACVTTLRPFLTIRRMPPDRSIPGACVLRLRQPLISKSTAKTSASCRIACRRRSALSCALDMDLFPDYPKWIWVLLRTSNTITRKRDAALHRKSRI